MADIDFTTDLTDGQMRIVISGNPGKVAGNRALLNRFEITFFTRTRIIRDGDTLMLDSYGGNADIFVNKPYVIGNRQAIAVAMATAVDQTVKCMQADEPQGTPNTERILNAMVDSVDVDTNGFLVARIRVIPAEVQSYDLLQFNLPITRV